MYMAGIWRKHFWKSPKKMILRKLKDTTANRMFPEETEALRITM